jgi:predicted RNA-binding protein associated with RNAse of E/G family
MDELAVRYLRLPDRSRTFRQTLVEDAGDHVVSFLRAADIEAPVRAGGRVVLEPGAPVVWFTYRGDVWHDVGRFHLRDGTFTGLYANVLTPVRMDGTEWETTDLFLDLWMGAGGEVEVLDRDELEEALRAGWISPALAERALREAETLREAALSGTWPAAHVGEWTLERVRGRLPGPPRTPEPRPEGP